MPPSRPSSPNHFGRIPATHSSTHGNSPRSCLEAESGCIQPLLPGADNGVCAGCLVDADGKASRTPIRPVPRQTSQVFLAGTSLHMGPPEESLTLSDPTYEP